MEPCDERAPGESVVPRYVCSLWCDICYCSLLGSILPAQVVCSCCNVSGPCILPVAVASSACWLHLAHWLC
jgi:hypothetical protein